MKRNTATILAAISCLLAAICLIQISMLSQRLGNLENNVIHQMHQVQNAVNGISGAFNASLQEQASLLSDSTWEYGKADYDARTVELICAVTPKEYAADTQAVILVGDTERPMALSGGTFTATIDIPLFGETLSMKVLFREGDTTRTELLPWHLSPRYDHLLNVYADLDGDASGSQTGGVYHYQRSGVLHINVDSKQSNGVTAITLVEVMDGMERGRTVIPPDNNTSFFANYQNESGAKPEPALSTTQTYEEPFGPLYYELQKNVDIPFGSTWMLYVELADSNGLLYRCVVDRQEINESGEPTDDGHWWVGMEAGIYDAYGYALYDPAAELYR